MRITELLRQDAIVAHLAANDKKGAIHELVRRLVATGALPARDETPILNALMAREQLSSTGIGDGIALPHGKGGSLRKIVAAVGISESGIDFDAVDGQPVHLVFLLVAPPDSAGPHLMALSRISKIVKDRQVRDALRSARDEQQVYRILQEQDRRMQ